MDRNIHPAYPCILHTPCVHPQWSSLCVVEARLAPGWWRGLVATWCCWRGGWLPHELQVLWLQRQRGGPISWHAGLVIGLLDLDYSELHVAGPEHLVTACGLALDSCTAGPWDVLWQRCDTVCVPCIVGLRHPLAPGD